MPRPPMTASSACQDPCRPTGRGEKVTAHTVWTGSTYDSSYYFNPFMEKYRTEGNVKYPFFLTPDRHYVGMAWYKRTVGIPKA